MLKSIPGLKIPNTLRGLMRLFESLAEPVELPDGQAFDGCLVGPWWLRMLGLPLLKIGALARWQGKQFGDNKHAYNRVERRGLTELVVPMAVSISPYTRGGGKAIALKYPKKSPFPWNFVLDELRPLGDGNYLGITTMDWPLIRRIPIPFVLMSMK